MSAITDKNTILNFLNGCGKDHLGRLYVETLAWSDKQLECCHDQIQWIFPLHEDSGMAQTWPVLSKEIVKEGKNDPKIIENLKHALKRFNIFYGIGENEDVEKQKKWCQNRNHNLLRITRIIRSLRLFGLNQEALQLYYAVIPVANRHGVSQLTFNYWEKAAYNDIWETLK